MSIETELMFEQVREGLARFNDSFDRHTKEDAKHFEEITRNSTDLKKDLAVIGEKIDGINRRLDITNGRIAKGEKIDVEQQREIDKLLYKLESTSEELQDHEKREENEKSQRRERYWDIKRTVVFSVLGFILMCVGALANTVLERTGVIDLSMEDASRINELVRQQEELQRAMDVMYGQNQNIIVHMEDLELIE